MKMQNGLLGNPLGVLGPVLYRKTKRGQSICVPRARFDRRSLTQLEQRRAFQWFMPRLSRIYNQIILPFTPDGHPWSTAWEWACWSCLISYDPRASTPHLLLWSDGNLDANMFVPEWRTMPRQGVYWDPTIQFVPWQDEGLVWVYMYSDIGKGAFFAPSPVWFGYGECFVADELLWEDYWYYIAFLFHIGPLGTVDAIAPATGAEIHGH